ncbi:MAG: phosphoribosylaminoimidazolesuccinocarboxamide synthase [Clostridiales bacterium]|nr:phosphoribosylaminoimidazolesuccinocarboxamide synthase [Clostridiales bacterium]
MPEIREIIREGKGKKIYATDDPDLAIVYFKDEAMAFHGLKRGRIVGKGEVNNQVCEHLFSLLAENGIESHFIERIDARHSLIRRCEMLPFCVKIRNRVAGQLATRTGLTVGLKLDQPVVEYVLRDVDMDYDPMINHTHIYAMKAATPEEMDQIDRICLKVNEILTAYLKEINIELIDFKLSFGRWHGKILVADEITPDTARFWDSSTHEPLDKDRFRRDMDNVAEAYQEVLHRMMGVG